ncbi:MAG: 5'-nucleotidase C-terminal domain-containing protein [Bacteroidia bacterium]|nr:5'-nucleotidase C-terminal domain-containing protein [Bacteroidia bacterium]NNJ54947.1 hypothetical protein [Bacteroidia bacterium]
MKSFFNIVLILILLGSCKPHQSVYTNPIPNIKIDSTLSSNRRIKKLIAPFKNVLQDKMDVVIGYSPAFLEKKRPSSALGNFMADAIYNVALNTGNKVDFCFLNYGGIRGTIDSGDITVGDIFRLMPFENEITIVKISKRQFYQILQQASKKGGEPFSYELIEIKNSVQLINRDFFYVATNDYLANGGDNYSMFTETTERIDTGIKIRDGLITYVKNFNPLPLDFNQRTF